MEKTKEPRLLTENNILEAILGGKRPSRETIRARERGWVDFFMREKTREQSCSRVGESAGGIGTNNDAKSLSIGNFSPFSGNFRKLIGKNSEKFT